MKYWILFLTFIIAGYFLWQYFPSFHDNFNRESILKADMAGGKTEQETFNLFVSALKRDDPDAAASYFILDQDLSRDNWVRTFRQLKEDGLLDKTANDLNIENIEFEFNNYSKVWKIKNL